MPGEELFELNNKINQIKNNINKRKEKVDEWNVPYKKILTVMIPICQNKVDKSIYLKKFYKPKSNQLIESSHDELRKTIKDKAFISRKKINQYHNQLKELDQLLKQKNMIRCLSLKKSQTKFSHNRDLEEETKRQIRSIKAQNQKQLLGEFDSQINFHRTLKDRINPFHNIKVDKFAQFYTQIKSGEDVSVQMMKTFGVGLDNTPLGRIIGQQLKKQQGKNTKQMSKKIKGKKGRINFAQSFTKTFNEKQNIFGNQVKTNLFENRMKKIINYHGEFWRQQFQIQQPSI